MKNILYISALFTIMVNYGYSQTFTLTDSLIAVYQFNGNALDSTANQNNGTLIGTTPATDRFGNAGGAVTFNGTSDYVDYTPAKNFKPTTFPASICAWVRYTGNSGMAGLVFDNDAPSNGNEFGVALNIVGANNQIVLSFCDGTAIGVGSRQSKFGTTNIGDGQWHFIAGVIRGAGDMDIYVDCKNDGGTYSGFGGPLAYDSNDGVTARSVPCASGCLPYNYYKGDIDEIRFYHRQLSSDDILRLYKISNNQLPTVSLGPDQAFCIPGSINLSPVSQTGASTYSWSTGSSSNSISVSTGGPYSLTVTDVKGCIASDTINVTGESAPSLILPGNISICPGHDTTFNISGATTYAWSPSGGLSNTTGAIVTANPTATTTYTVIGTLTGGCTAQGTIVVAASSNLISSVIPSDTSLCSGNSAQLNVTGAANQYMWSPSSGLSSSTIANPVATPTVNTTYTVSVSNSAGCSATDIVTVNVNPGSVAGVISAIKDTICANTVAHLSVAGNSGGVTWQSSADSTTGFHTITGTTGTTYGPLLNNSTYFRVIVGTGPCADTSAAFKMNVVAAPLAKFSWSTNGHTVTFNSDSSLDAITYLWDFNDGKTSTMLNPTHTFDSVKVYHVCLTIKNNSNCNYTLCQNITIYPTGTNDISDNNNWFVYPDPFTNQLYIDMGSNGVRIEKIELFDVLGRRVFEAKDITQSLVKLDLSRLTTGAYFLRIMSPQGEFVRSVIKE